MNQAVKLEVVPLTVIKSNEAIHFHKYMYVCAMYVHTCMYVYMCLYVYMIVLNVGFGN